MKRAFLVLGVLALLVLIVACSAPPAPTAVPPTAVPAATKPAPTTAPVATSVPAATSAPATTAPKATEAPKPTEAPKATAAPAATTAPTAAPSGSGGPAAGKPQVVELTLTPTDMKPGEITVKVGSTVHFVITNTDKTEEHNLVAAKAKLKEILVAPKSTVEADWVVPATPGDFEVPCSIHREIIPLMVHIVP